MLEWKKTVLESLKDFLYNVQKIFSIFFFVFYCPPFGGGSSAASPLKIWDVMPPYLKTLFEQKIRNLIILTILSDLIPLKWSCMCVEICVKISDKSDKKWRSYSLYKLTN